MNLLLLFASAISSFATASVSTPVTRRVPGTLRVVTWNIGANSVVPSAWSHGADNTRPAAFARVVRALDADLACLQELDIGAERVAQLFDAVHPLPRGARWHAVSELGNVLVSRYPLTQRRGATLRHRLSQRGHVVARVSTPSGAAPTVACMHLQSSGGASNVAFRTRHAAAVVRDIGHPDGPVIVLGDLNAVDRAKPYLAVLQHGLRADSAPFPLTVARAVHNGSGSDAYTWRSDRSGFAPGLLDFVMYSASRYSVLNAFVLNTVTMSADQRATAGLESGDVLRGGVRGAATGEYDHLPVVADLSPLP